MMTYSKDVINLESEADFQKKLIELLHCFGYKVCEFRKARIMKGGVDTYRTPFGADGVGFPDLFVLHPDSGVSFYVECKSQKGKLRPEQKEWIDWLRRCGHMVFVWRPDDWDIIIMPTTGGLASSIEIKEVE